ncbi:hypothetical protein BDP27DRAFT_1369386 [Rhodocollybia butyracea]|uniref:Uncharacterized protein n=1 Tax=Rhodocollybia butyracea TaxID=206335 RepID=A0A9P5PGQ7_9AGAR|nr:hypothetical protein BDP27DRAFT_1369386 [Rhodocollybia butyracea]
MPSPRFAMARKRRSHLFKLKRSTSTFQLHGNAKASCRQSLDLTASRMHAHVPPKAVGTQAGPRDTNSLYHNRWISVLLRNSSTAGNLGAGWEYRGQAVLTLLTRTRAKASQMVCRVASATVSSPRIPLSDRYPLDTVLRRITASNQPMASAQGQQPRPRPWNPNIHTLQHTHGLIHFYAKFPLISGVKYNGFGKMISAAFSSNHQLYGIHISELLTQKPLVFAAGIFGAKAMLNVQDTSEMLRRQWAVLSVDPAALQRTCASALFTELHGFNEDDWDEMDYAVSSATSLRLADTGTTFENSCFHDRLVGDLSVRRKSRFPPMLPRDNEGLYGFRRPPVEYPIAVVLSLQVFLFDLEYMCKYLRILSEANDLSSPSSIGSASTGFPANSESKRFLCFLAYQLKMCYFLCLEPVALEIHHVHLRYCASRELQEGYNPNLLETGKKQMDADSESSNGKEGYPANGDFGQLSSLRRSSLLPHYPRHKTSHTITITNLQNVQGATSTNTSSSATSTAPEQSVQPVPQPQPRRRGTS